VPTILALTLPSGSFPAALYPSLPFAPPELAQALPWLVGGAALSLLGSVALATLRVSLWSSRPARVLEKSASEERRQRLAPLLERVPLLVTSSRLLEHICDALFALLVLACLSTQGFITWQTVAGTLLATAPVLLIAKQSLAYALARRFGDGLLVRALPAFHALSLPLAWPARMLDATGRTLQRMLGVDDDLNASRRIVEGLREVIADAAISGDLDDTERTIIGNVMDFREADVAAVMTPRTEIHASDVKDGVQGALAVLARCGHSRIPIYENNLDSIIGTLSARDLVQLMARGTVDSADLRKVVHRAYFVPETKRVVELLAEFQREKVKHAIVLDEYGGTAGMVTATDVLTEIVGELHDEFDKMTPLPVRELGGGAAEVEATMHVSEVNEALDLEIPEEEDYETLGGFVLAELGHFPAKGESFRRGKAEFSVLEANDRRVLKVLVRRTEPVEAS
jgi:CBS domain containing-hemolysin-like protein